MNQFECAWLEHFPVEVDPGSPQKMQQAKDKSAFRDSNRVESALEMTPLVTGRGRFTSDVQVEGALHVVFLRSPVAGMQIETLDVSAAKAHPGVKAVLTSADLAHLKQLPVNAVGLEPFAPAVTYLADGQVDAVGQAIVAVVAERLSDAEDAAEVIEISFAPAQAFVPTKVTTSQWSAGEPETIFATAPHVVSVRHTAARVAPSPLEPRSILAVPEANRGLTVWHSTQTPHRTRENLCALLGLDPTRVRVAAPDVGGAFGAKASLSLEDVVTAFAAIHLGQPVRWTATRSEEFQSGNHGRGGHVAGRLAVDADGRALALEISADFEIGHWSPFSGLMPALNVVRIGPGPYAIAAGQARGQVRTTARAPVGIYRGAGRPESTLLLERLMDQAAQATGLDPLEIRRRNVLAPAQLPYQHTSGAMPCSGDFAGLLAALSDRADYPARRARIAKDRSQGIVAGLGVALFVEPCGKGTEFAAVKLDATGKIIAATGSTNQGQRRQAATRRIVGSALGIAPETIDVLIGDTATVADGVGALASRGTPIGGAALHGAAIELRARLASLAGRHLNQSVDKITFDDHGARSTGVDRHLPWRDLVTQAASEGIDLDVSHTYTAPGEAWSSGACLVEISVDRETGVLTVRDIVWIDDAGPLIDPQSAKDQLLGGAVQGLGEALMEQIIYDGDGQLLTGSLMDYALPRADDIPPFAIDSRPTPSPMNVLGAKGIGEAGPVGLPAAILNAAFDALRPLCTDVHDMPELSLPLTSAKLWRAMQQIAPSGSSSP